MTSRASMQSNSALNSNAGDISFDFLDLPDCVTARKDRIEHILLVRAFYEPKLPNTCPICNKTWRAAPETKKLEPFWDIPKADCPVLVQLFVPVMLCGGCGRPLTIELDWLHATRKMTYRLEDYILNRAATLSTFTQIALDTGQDPNTVIDIFLLAFREFDRARGKDLPRVLQIDEVHFHGRYYTILVDGELDTAVDLLEGRTKEIIAARLKQAGNRDAVEYVTQDFYAPFRTVTTQPTSSVPPENSDDDTFATPLFGDMPRTDAYVGDKYSQIAPEILRALLPNAKTVGDHFHFKKKIEECFNNVRIHVTKYLGRFFLNQMKKTYTKQEIADASIQRELKAEVDRLTKYRSAELTDNWRILSRNPESLTDEEDWMRLKKIFTDHPLLEKAWQAKNRGLAIFPRKPPIGRSKQAKREAMAKRMEQLMDAEEAGRRLDAWVNSIDTQLLPYFRAVTNLISIWREPIIRIGTTPYSNAGAESKNRFLRMLEAISRGLNFEQLRARLLWADAHRRTDRWPACFSDIDDRMTTQRFIELADAWLARDPEQ